MPEVHAGPLLELVRVPLDVIMSLRHVSCTTWLGIVCRLAESVLDRTVLILNSTGSSTDYQGTPLITDLHLDIELLTTTLWM